MKKRLVFVLLTVAALALLGFLLLQIPAVAWRADVLMTQLGERLHPAGNLPTALPVTQAAATDTPTATISPMADETPVTPTPEATTVPTPSATPLPQQVILQEPKFEGQDWNNCGPAALALYLRFYGWAGDQFTIADAIKPERGDRNVNVDELLYYVRNNAGWLESDFRVDGSVEELQAYLAAGIPVMIETGFILEEGAIGLRGPSDDRWTGHYLLLTGYDADRQVFISQDAYKGANIEISFADLDLFWQAFNRMYMLIYLPAQADTVTGILGEDADAEINRRHALEMAQLETQKDPGNAFAWFNLGTNLTYFERYNEAANAYDQARAIGLPQRMLRYQFGPFLAYFHSLRTEDLMAISDYALKITDNSEEAWMWKGWALYRNGDIEGARASFEKALQYHPGYADAQYGLDFLAGQ